MQRKAGTELSLQCCCSLGACGQLLLEPSGLVDLKNMTGSCIVSIGRPLDEVIHIEVKSGSLNCRKSKFCLIRSLILILVTHTSGE